MTNKSWNSGLLPYVRSGTQIKTDKGYIFPITLVMSMLLSSFLLHQLEVYRLEKMFFHESEQLFELESMMKYSWDRVEHDLLRESYPPLSSITFPNGTAVITTEDSFPHDRIKIICTTKESRRYEATIIYDRENHNVISWYETS